MENGCDCTLLRENMNGSKTPNSDDTSTVQKLRNSLQPSALVKIVHGSGCLDALRKDSPNWIDEADLKNRRSQA